jgi:predicted Zn-dependent protease
MKFVLWAFLVLLVSTVSGCATNPVTGEDELRLITTSQEVAMGQNLDAQVRTQYKVVTGTPQANRVQAIGAKIAAVADRKDLQYHFALLDTTELNAFATPGGYVYVTTELANAAPGDSELAGVIGHEVGHVAALHSVHQVQRALGWDIVTILITSDPKSEQAMSAADVAFNNVVMTGFSRQDEYQADELGVKYSAKAGYDPYGLARFFDVLQAREQSGKVDRRFEFMMSHPNTPDRKRRVEAEAAKYPRSPR